MRKFKALGNCDHSSPVADHLKTTCYNIKWDHFEILVSSKPDFHCKIKETLFIQELKPSCNVNVSIVRSCGFISCYFSLQVNVLQTADHFSHSGFHIEFSKKLYWSFLKTSSCVLKCVAIQRLSLLFVLHVTIF